MAWCVQAFGYLVQAFFDKAMTGGIVGMILSFAMFVVKLAVITPDTPHAKQMWLSLLAPTAFAQGITLIATYEKNGEALDFGSMTTRVDNFSFVRTFHDPAEPSGLHSSTSTAIWPL